MIQFLMNIILDHSGCEWTKAMFTLYWIVKQFAAEILLGHWEQ